MRFFYSFQTTNPSVRRREDVPASHRNPSIVVLQLLHLSSTQVTVGNLTRLIPVVNCVTVYRCVFRGRGRGRGRNCHIVLKDGMAPRNCRIVFHTEDEMAQHLRIAHETEIFNLYRIRHVISEEGMKDDFHNYLIQAERDKKARHETEICHLRKEEMDADYYNYLIQTHGKEDVRGLRIAHETEIPNLCRIGRAISEEEEMEDDFDTYLIKVARNCRNSYRCFFEGGYCSQIFDTEDEMTQHLRFKHCTETIDIYNYIIGIYEEKVEDDFGRYLIRVARDCGTEYRCCFGRSCRWFRTGDDMFHTEDEMVGHLKEVHETELLSMYNLLNGILAAVRRALSEEGTKPNIRTSVIDFVRRIETRYRNLAEQRRGSTPYGWWDDYNEKASIEEASIGRAITEKEMEVDFHTYVFQVPRRYASIYRCVYCRKELDWEWEMVYHLRKPESDGGHETEMRKLFSKEQAEEQELSKKKKS